MKNNHIMLTLAAIVCLTAMVHFESKTDTTREMVLQITTNQTDLLDLVSTIRSNAVSDIVLAQQTMEARLQERFDQNEDQYKHDRQSWLDALDSEKKKMEQLAENIQQVKLSIPTNSIPERLQFREWHVQDPAKQTSVGPSLGAKRPIWVLGYTDSNGWHSLVAYKKESYTNLDAELNGKE